MTLKGHVLSFDERTYWGEVGYDLEVLKFHSTSFQGNRHPIVGEPVEIVLSDTYNVLSVRSRR
jgi:photosystem II stability/assembly factor-like uncharacterized protein